MFSAVYEGILLGIFLAFSIGPSFFALINTGIRHGFKSGAAVAFGILFSDLFFVVATVSLIHFGMADLISSPKHQSFMGVIGGVVLIIYGVVHFIQRENKSEENTQIEVQAKNLHVFPFIVKGFFLNLFNPFVWIFWLATSTAISSKYEFHIYRIVVFFISVLSVVITTDLLKTFVGHKIKQKLNEKILLRIRHVSGALLICFGLYLIYKVFFLH
ncbi:MAG: LysE family transporter [Bacteroidetes bacterium]|nr:LysE family transporter [Bacteroidota bacterium]